MKSPYSLLEGFCTTWTRRATADASSSWTPANNQVKLSELQRIGERKEERPVYELSCDDLDPTLRLPQ